jgi:hypothetical protein
LYGWCHISHSLLSSTLTAFFSQLPVTANNCKDLQTSFIQLPVKAYYCKYLLISFKQTRQNRIIKID